MIEDFRLKIEDLWNPVYFKKVIEIIDKIDQQLDALDMKAIRWLNSCNRNRKAEHKMAEYLHYSIFNLQFFVRGGIEQHA